MVCCDVAGVLFTRDPRDAAAPAAGALVVEAVRGLGDQLVAGRVTPERLVIPRSALTGPPGAWPHSTLLSSAEIDELGRVGLTIEAIFAAPVDIEWGLTARESLECGDRAPLSDSGGGNDVAREGKRRQVAALQRQFVLFQARPIVASQPAGGRTTPTPETLLEDVRDRLKDLAARGARGVGSAACTGSSATGHRGGRARMAFSSGSAAGSMPIPIG
jgi:hypothetical protein